MDFFAHQEAARKKTGLLVTYFVLAILLIILAIYVVALLLVNPVALFPKEAGQAAAPIQPNILLAVAAGTLAVIGLGSAFKIAQLAGGGARVAENLSGRLLRPDIADFKEKRLLNIVEEMALASGVPVPPVYVMDREQGVNAFAAGFKPGNAVIGVTRGLLNVLSRYEQQGVIAHEFSHILNGDMGLNIKLMGLIHGILVISLIGRGMMEGASRVRTSKNNGAVVGIVLGLTLMLIGMAGVFFGKLIKRAVSRQREFLADASAAQFTRNPEGLASALKKIGGLAAGSRIRHARAEEASHMFFGNGLRSLGPGLLATHPPLVDRIRRLDPGFDGVFPKVRRPGPPPVPGQAGSGAGLDDLPFGQTLPGVPDVGVPGLGAVAAILTAEQLLGSIGQPMQRHLEAARAILDGLPESLHAAAHGEAGARAIVYLLLLDKTPALRERQLKALRGRMGDDAVDTVSGLPAASAAVRPEARLPLLDLAMPSLKRMPRDVYEDFKKAVEDLVAADRSIDLFEYALRHTLLRNLDEHFGLAPRKPAQIYALRGVDAECSCLFSLLARLGHADEESSGKAFEAAVAIVRGPGMDFTFLPRDACGLDRVDAALNKMCLLTPNLKKSIIAACLECITHDREITVAEAELFRAVASALECPVPPWMLSQIEECFYE